MKTTLLKTILALTVCVGVQTQLQAQGTAFTYQGRLNFNGSPTAGIFDLRFAVFDAGTNGGQLGGTLTNSATAVTNGLFTATVDFGAGIFTGPDRWLEIAARTNGGGTFTTLAPRQQITPTPFAIFANTASNVLGSVPSTQITGTISPAQLSANVITNTQTGVTLGGTFSGNGGGLTNLNASALATGTVPTNVLAGFQAPYYAAIGGGQLNVAANTYAVVGGGYANSASYVSSVGGGYNNNASGYFATIPGGQYNIASGQFSFAAGQQAQAVHQGAFVWADSQPAPFASSGTNTFNVRAFGGVNFQTRAAPMTLNGLNVLTTANLGNFWQTTGNASTTPANGNFLGTTDNQPLEIWVNNLRAQRIEPNTNGAPNLIGGSVLNFIAAGVSGATIGGGGVTNYQGSAGSNAIASDYAAIFGGVGNQIFSGNPTAFIGGGRFNSISNGNISAVIAGGAYNQIQSSAYDSMIGGGIGNLVQSNAIFSTIVGGSGNVAGASYAAVAGGRANYAIGVSSFVGGGGSDGTILASNVVNSAAASIVGGLGNYIDLNSTGAAIGGGAYNMVSYNSTSSVVAGGISNYLYGAASVIGGGTANYLSGGYANTIGGGSRNLLGSSCKYSTVPGGLLNSCSADYAFAAGSLAQAIHPGSFVWADSQGTFFQSTASNQFAVRAGGGALLNVGTNNVEIASGGGLKFTGAGINTGTAAFVQLSSAANNSGNQTIINNPLCNNNSNAILVVTHNFNPGGAPVASIHNHAVGVFYSGGQWRIYNEDQSNMATNIAFNVLVIKP